MAGKRPVPGASVTPARIAGPVAVTFAPTNGAPAESVSLTVIVSVAAELVAGRGRGGAGLAVCGAPRGAVAGGGWPAAAVRRGAPGRPRGPHGPGPLRRRPTRSRGPSRGEPWQDESCP